jgi:hypothetical protein
MHLSLMSTTDMSEQLIGVPREQADLPAEQPASCEDPRFPSAYAYPRWSRDSRSTPP